MRDDIDAGVIDEVFAEAMTMGVGPTAPLHQPVMGAEVLHYLRPRPGGVVVDGTTGTGGHSLMILPRLLPHGRLIAIDRDRDSLDVAQGRMAEFFPQVTLLHDNYRNLPTLLATLSCPRVDGLLLDLGMSSPQVDRPERGFSFLKEGPLDMRMDRSQGEMAESIVNSWSADELAAILGMLGEERFARRIANRIIQERRRHPMTTTVQLARAVVEAVPAGARHGRLHPATRTFQALRMAVNDELGALETLLGRLGDLLNPGGRAVILAYHSLEDRLVKRAFAQGLRDRRWRVLTKKPVTPSEGEETSNPRARSAKLRAIERTTAATDPTGTQRP